MKKLLLSLFYIFILFGANADNYPGATVEYVRLVTQKHGCNITNIAPQNQGANTEYLLKTIDICNNGATSYGTGAFATKQWANTRAVDVGVKKLLDYPPYAQNGLIVFLDSNIDSSFTGTTWRDLSGNNNHFTMYNSPVLGDDGLVLNGINNYIRSINMLNFTTYSAVTVEVRVIENPSGYCHIFEHSPDWNSNMGGFGMYINTQGIQYYKDMIHTNQTGGTPVSNPRNYKLSNIGTVSHTYTNTFSSVVNPRGRLFYYDAKETGADNTVATNYQITTDLYKPFRSDFFFMGARGGTINPSKITIQSVRIYNRQLTPAEVCNNAWSDYWRFGGAIPSCQN